MDIPAFERLREQHTITAEELEAVKTHAQTQPLSVHWDLRTLLYFGIFLLATGTGIIVYENIDTIGHDVMIGIIALGCAACFIYCFKKSKGYSNHKTPSPNVWFDYILLLAALLLLTLIGYLQFQYNAFGNRWGLATFIPMIILFATAYYFDHLGVLSLAITNLAAWVGIAVTPLRVLQDNDFNDEQIILSGVVLGAGLIAFAALTVAKHIKSHFAFTYKNFGVHILFIASLAALFHFEGIFIFIFIAFCGIAFYLYKNALKENSFYFLVVTLLYSYIAAGYMVIRLLDFSADTALYLILLYFIASGIGLIRLLMYYNKTIKVHDGIQ